MRRLTITLTAAAMLLVLAPAGASAHNRRHHSRHHARIERFGRDSSTTSSSSTDAGTIQSFQSGVLTIVLRSDGSTVSGVVNNDTEIECTSSSTTMHEDGDGGSGDSSGSNDTSGDGGDNTTSGDNTTQTEDQNDDANESNDNDDEAEQSCSSANLTPGTMVREAELRLTSTGAVWKDVELDS